MSGAVGGQGHRLDRAIGMKGHQAQRMIPFVLDDQKTAVRKLLYGRRLVDAGQGPESRNVVIAHSHILTPLALSTARRWRIHARSAPSAQAGRAAGMRCAASIAFGRSAALSHGCHAQA